jgi:aspartyl-tRNA(Asn)/glutamyl-tRNA(Gln) amidotransferase subunit A
MATSPTRDYFRAALEQVQGYAVDASSRRPAFVSPHDAPAVPVRKPLLDLPEARPKPPLLGLTIADAIQRMAAGSLSASGLVKEALGNIAERNRALNAFAYLVPEGDLLAQAQRLDSERRRGIVRGALHGIPVTIKDVIDVQGMPSTASSRVLAGNVATEDAASVWLLKEAGAIILGKVHTHEFALGVTTPQSRNPWDPARDPGGSSGGSAIAVATGMGLASLGTDTRASIRVPAALCGVVGYKPTYDLISTRGVITLSWSLDHVAPMARTVEDIALLLNVLAVAGQTTDYTRFLAKDVSGLRVGLPVHSLPGADPEVLASFNAAVSALRSINVEVVECDFPSSDDFSLANAMGLIVSRCEAAVYHSWFRSGASLYTTPVFEQLDEASRVTAVDYLQAQRFRAAIRQRMLEHLGRFDAFIMPTCRVQAPKSEGAERFLLVLSQNCILWSFIGFPAVSLPCGRTPKGLPVGAQLVAAPGEDGRLLALASALEAALPSPSPR